MNNKLLILTILILLIALGYCFYLLNTRTQISTEQPAPAQTASTTKEATKPATQTTSKKDCIALHVTSPLPNTVVNFPVTIRGTIDNSIGCKWGVFEGVAGVVELAFQDGTTWHTISRMNQITLEDWMQPVTHFSATIDFDNEAIGLPTKTPMKFTFKAENPSGLPENDLSMELPFIFGTTQNNSGGLHPN